MGVAGGRMRVVVAEAGGDGGGRGRGGEAGVDGDGRGGEVVARALRDAGVEVVYLGGRQTPERIVGTAIQEDADAIGLAVRSDAGALFAVVVDLLREHDAADILVFGEGAVPEADVPTLREKGVAEIFGPGVTPRAVVEWVRGSLRPSAGSGG